MAGFDYQLNTKPAHKIYLRRILGLLQKLAHQRKLKYRYRWDGQNFRVSVDGSLKDMQGMRLSVNFLAHYWSLHSAPELSSNTRRVICERVIFEHLRGLERISDGVAEIASLFGGAANSYYFDSGKATNLKGQLMVLTDSLIRYKNGLNSASETAECVHTTIELIMRHRLGPGVKASYEDMVNILTQKGRLAALREDVICLKNLRKGAKHHGRLIADSKLQCVLPNNIEFVHLILRQIRSAN